MDNAKELFDNAEFYRAIPVNEALTIATANGILSYSKSIIVDDPIIKDLLKNRNFKEDLIQLPWRKHNDHHHEINLTNLQNRPAGFGPVIAAIDVKRNCLLFDEYVVVEDAKYCIIRALKYYDQYYTLKEFGQRAL